MRVYEGFRCLGAPIESGQTPTADFFLAPGEYSVAEEVRPGWIRISPERFCINVTVVSGLATMINFLNRPDRNGDVNKDGVANAVDATLLLQLVSFLLQSEDLIEQYGLANAVRLDVNQDNDHTAVDALLILQHGAGLVDSLPVAGA